MTNQNAAYIRELVDHTTQVGGERIEGKTKDEAKQNVLRILQQQLKQSNQNVRTQTY